MTNVIQFVPRSERTYAAKLMKVHTLSGDFHIAGTLEGLLDFAVMDGKTYQLTCDDARSMIAALNSVIEDIQKNCLFDQDALLCDRS